MSEEIPCAECLIFQQFKTHPDRALICETARAVGECLMMKRLVKAQTHIETYPKPQDDKYVVKSTMPGYWKDTQNLDLYAKDVENWLNDLKKVLVGETCKNIEHRHPCYRNEYCPNCGISTCSPNYAYHVCVAPRSENVLGDEKQ